MRMRRASRRTALEPLRRLSRTMLLAGVDELATVCVIAFVLAIGRFLQLQSLEAARCLWPVAGFTPILCAAMGLYPGLRIGSVETIRRTTIATTLSFALAAAAGIASGRWCTIQLAALTIAWPLAATVLPAARLALRSACGSREWWNEPAVLMAKPGDPPAENLIRSARALGYSVVKTIELGSEDSGTDMIPHGLEDGARDYGAGTAIVCGRPGDDRLLPGMQRMFRRVVVLQSIPGMPVEHQDIGSDGDLIGIEFSNHLLLWRNRMLKRALDLVLASSMLALSAPIILLAGIAIKIASSGPMFFRQQRDGLNGRPIVVRKIRTMYSDAEERLRECLAGDSVLRREWDSRMKLSRDPRVVPVIGTLLRRLSLDELPQLFNVLSGDMSMVGPRPFPRYHVDRFEPAFRRLRAAVRPGVTGMWQVMVRSEGGIEEQVQYDSHYIRNWSIWLDLYILARTAAVVLSGRGAY
jgi:Undecaprenyl-phosphate galactose phosphotransferase WbaP